MKNILFICCLLFVSFAGNCSNEFNFKEDDTIFQNQLSSTELWDILFDPSELYENSKPTLIKNEEETTVYENYLSSPNTTKNKGKRELLIEEKKEKKKIKITIEEKNNEGQKLLINIENKNFISIKKNNSLNIKFTSYNPNFLEKNQNDLTSDLSNKEIWDFLLDSSELTKKIAPTPVKIEEINSHSEEKHSSSKNKKRKFTLKKKEVNNKENLLDNLERNKLPKDSKKLLKDEIKTNIKEDIRRGQKLGHNGLSKEDFLKILCLVNQSFEKSEPNKKSPVKILNSKLENEIVNLKCKSSTLKTHSRKLRNIICSLNCIKNNLIDLDPIFSEAPEKSRQILDILNEESNFTPNPEFFKSKISPLQFSRLIACYLCYGKPVTLSNLINKKSELSIRTMNHLEKMKLCLGI